MKGKAKTRKIIRPLKNCFNCRRRNGSCVSGSKEAMDCINHRFSKLKVSGIADIHARRLENET